MFNLHNLAGAWTYAIRTLPVILTLSCSEGEGSPAKEILHFVQNDGNPFSRTGARLARVETGYAQQQESQGISVPLGRAGPSLVLDDSRAGKRLGPGMARALGPVRAWERQYVPRMEKGETPARRWPPGRTDAG